MQIQSPDELMGLFFKYQLKKLPVIKDNRVRGSLHKSDLVSCLRKTDQFSRNVVQVIEELLDPADRDVLEGLREKLREGEIEGLPIINFSGQVQRVITPGVLRAESESREFLDQSEQLSVFENFLLKFPFPVELEANGDQIFTNEKEVDRPEGDALEWTELEFEEDKYVLRVFLPSAVDKLRQAFESLDNGDGVELRPVMTEIESELLQFSQERSETVTSAAEKVNLPRQTFNYRLEKLLESDE